MTKLAKFSPGESFNYMVCTVESRYYACPHLFCTLTVGKTGEGAYSWNYYYTGIYVQFMYVLNSLLYTNRNIESYTIFDEAEKPTATHPVVLASM